VSTPGRICLFGEHQDYLLLPVIPAAISLRIAVEGAHRNDRMVRIALPDISSSVAFELRDRLAYVDERDYFRSSVNVLQAAGFTFSRGCDAVVRGEIPINAGTSSSSALVVSWINFLARMSDQEAVLAPEACARYAHAAEVEEFHEPGGMMDQYCAAYGGVLYLEFAPRPSVEALEVRFGAFVLGDSMEPKDTKGILARVKDRVVEISRRLAAEHARCSLPTVDRRQLPELAGKLSGDDFRVFDGAVHNRDITREARKLLAAAPLDEQRFGSLLLEHQKVLREELGISTPKIDRMLDAALAAGALGGKINGSGGGGCMFAYAPDRPQAVAEAIAASGGKPWIVTVDAGTRIEAVEAVR
jgi:galactokinase